MSDPVCCCEEHDLTMTDEHGHHPVDEVPDGHGSVYAGTSKERWHGKFWPRGLMCPSCPVHGVAAGTATSHAD